MGVFTLLKLYKWYQVAQNVLFVHFTNTSLHYNKLLQENCAHSLSVILYALFHYILAGKGECRPGYYAALK